MSKLRGNGIAHILAKKQKNKHFFIVFSAFYSETRHGTVVMETHYEDICHYVTIFHFNPQRLLSTRSI
ncbi:MAG: hypothetical protein MJZ28_06700 [Paludibacteraceae bacterium]|nr:hypothetical protein [Paludibacteraceae bacterium]